MHKISRDHRASNEKKILIPRAPDELMIEFLAAVSEGNYNLALTKCSSALKHEPRNAMLKEYQKVLQQALKAKDDEEDKESSNSSSSDEDETDSDDDDERKEYENEEESENEEVTLAEMRQDLTEQGVQGTKRGRWKI